ncbi:TetR/AcrR family transcriptional regulator [Clostridium algidicarnis]|uniref:TetR/AcrR family transcriptional regulator n=1 Tax=Clostridium algidicarnis TaxID=37659 RepID=UPI000CEB342F|nr:TetR/AcrR family transcriptional regulator [Clostridium algidicarnis]MBB6697315.1 TetR/AcrR family transcriptional regulator [Clostridium algidicarnis]MCB2287341.1 TetR/AcrR family transcriptional regulator [Clostridium algidicarnis]
MTKKDEIKSKSENKKLIKEKDLYSAAYELFTTKGFQNTAIDDIVKKAGVAKGTFYLYFKDKYDIINKIILQKSSGLIKEAMQKTKEESFEDFIEMFLFYVNYIIEYLKDNKLMLKIVNKNFSWGVYRRAIMRPEQHEEMREVIDIFIVNMESLGTDKKESEKILFMIIELIGSVCYSSIILEEPYDMDTMKPILFKTIKKMLEV